MPTEPGFDNDDLFVEGSLYGNALYASEESGLYISGALALRVAADGITKLGWNAGSNATGFYNTLLGNRSGWRLSTGAQNTFVGTFSGQEITTGDGNVILGYAAAVNATTCSGCVFIGGAATVGIVTGDRNIAIGFDAGKNLTSAADNICLGNDSGQTLTTGGSNFALGPGALNSCSTGTGNLCIGGGAGDAILGSGNICIGKQSGIYETGSNGLYIGNATVNARRPIMYANMGSTGFTIHHFLLQAAASDFFRIAVDADSITSGRFIIEGWGSEGAIEAVSDNGGLIQIQITGHSLETGDRAHVIDGGSLHENAYGDWVITKIDANNFTLDSSTFGDTVVGGSVDKINEWFTVGDDGDVNTMGDVTLSGGLDFGTSFTCTPTDVNAASYLVVSTDHYLQVRYTGTGVVTIALPTIANVGGGYVLYVYDSGYNANNFNIDINRSSTDTIDNGVTIAISTAGGSVRLTSNATTDDWEVFTSA